MKVGDSKEVSNGCHGKKPPVEPVNIVPARINPAPQQSPLQVQIASLHCVPLAMTLIWLSLPTSPLPESLLDLWDDEARDLLIANGTRLIRKIGLDTTRQVVLDVLSGRNLRDSTELLTRRRLAALNTAMLRMIMAGTQEQKKFVEQLSE